MLSRPVLIHGKYYNSMGLAGKALQVDTNTVKNRIRLGVDGYAFCEYRPPLERSCPQCGEIKHLKKFKKAKTNRCGRSHWCKKCHSADVVKHLQTEQGKALSKKRIAKYRKTETCKKARSRYKNGGAGKASKARYGHQRRARAKKLINDLTANDWSDILREQGHRCGACKRSFNDKLLPQRDHIIPVSKNGHFTKENVQALCLRCNSIKGDKVEASINCGLNPNTNQAIQIGGTK